MGVSNLGNPLSQAEVQNQYLDTSGKIKDAFSIDNSLAAHIRWRKQYKSPCKGKLAMITSCLTKEAVEYQEAVEYLSMEWIIYESAQQSC